MYCTSTLFRGVYCFCATSAALLLLASCGLLTENFSQLGQDKHYPIATAREQTVIEHPPRVKLSHYHSVQAPSRRWQRSDLAVAVAASGGGYRAANLTAGVLLGLESIRFDALSANLLSEIDYFSTVSGGGFAIGLYLSRLLKHLEADSAHAYSFKHDFENHPDTINEKLRVNYAGDLFFGYRRSINLQQKLSKHLLTIDGQRQLMLGDMFIAKNSPEDKVRLPLWVSNASIIQNSQMFQFTPDVISQYQVSHFIHDAKVYRLDNTTDSLYGFDMPAGVGLIASAAFPYAVAGTTLWSSGCKDKACYLQLFDGGLIDNLGLLTAVDLLRQDKARKQVLIIIDAFQGNLQPYTNERQPPKKFDLLQRLLMLSSETMQRNLKAYTPTIAKDLLCTAGAEQVLVIYLDLSQIKDIEKVHTRLWISEEQQAAMLEAGKTLVKNNQALNVSVAQMLRDATFSAC